MDKLSSFIKNPAQMIIVILVLLGASGIMFGVGRNIQTNTAGYEAKHVDTPADASLVTIAGDEILDEEIFSEIRGRILNNIYGEHYDKTGLVERQARYISDIDKTDQNSYSFEIAFEPSKTRYDVDLSIKDTEENDFSINVRQVK